jgi:hypothetical protein
VVARAGLARQNMRTAAGSSRGTIGSSVSRSAAHALSGGTHFTRSVSPVRTTGTSAAVTAGTRGGRHR